MKRRTRGLLTALVLCVLGGVVFAACGEKEEPHTHQWGEWQITTPAGCETEGVKERSCSGCSEKQTDTIEKTGHEWNEWQVTTPAGCETDGVKERTCKNCTEKQTDTVAQTGHSWDAGRVTVQPTYAKDGAKEFTCQNSDCEETKTETVERLGYEKKTQDVWTSKSIKILAIGNSLTDDSLQYLPEILHGVGFTNVTVGKAWIGGSTLSNHVDNLASDAAKYTWELYTEQEKWVVTRSFTLSAAFDYTDWDYVVISTSGWEQGLDTFVTEDLESAVQTIIERSGDTAVPVWYMPPAYREPGILEYYTGGQREHFEKSIAAAKEKVVPIKDYMAIIPTMAAMQNFRAEYGDGVTNRDDTHMSYPVGCTISGLAWAMTFAPQADFDGLTLDFVKPALLEDMIEAVRAAHAAPFVLTPLSTGGGEAIPNYSVKNGSFKAKGDGFRSLEKSSLIVGNTEIAAGTISFKLRYATLGWCGVIFNHTGSGNSYWESGVDYYFAGIDENGAAMLVKVNGTSAPTWNVLKTAALPKLEGEDYTMEVRFKEGHIAFYVNDVYVLGYTDAQPFTGTAWGFRSERRGVVFSDITATANDSVEVPAPVVYPAIEGYTKRNGEFSHNAETGAFTTQTANALLQRNENWNGGTVTYDFTMGAAADTGIIFGLSAEGLENFWENKGASYYMAAISKSGGVAFAAVNLNESTTWKWLTEPANNVIRLFDPLKTYSVTLGWNPMLGYMEISVGGVKVVCSDATLKGRGFGMRGAQPGNTWENFVFTDTMPAPAGVENGIWIKTGAWEVGTDENGKKSYTNTQGGSAFVFTNVNVETLGNDVTIEYDYKGTFVGNDVQGVLFGWNAAEVEFCRNHLAIGRQASEKKTGCGVWYNGNSWEWAGSIGAKKTNIFTDDTKTYAIKIVWHRKHEAGASLFDIYVDDVLAWQRTMGTACTDENFTCIGLTSGKGESYATFSNFRINGKEV